MSFQISSMVPEIWCSDFDASLAFYTEHLEFEIGQRKPGVSHAYLTFHDSQLMLGQWDIDGRWEPWHPEPMEKPFGRGINIQFLTPDVRTFYQEVSQKTGDVFVELYEVEYWRSGLIDTRLEFGVLDPDGYLLRFAQTIGTRSE